MLDFVGWMILGAVALAAYFAKRTRPSFEHTRSAVLLLPGATQKVSGLRNDRLAFLFFVAMFGAGVGAAIWAALEILVWLLNH